MLSDKDPQGPKRRVNSVKNLLYVAAVVAFFIVLFGYTPADAFREKGVIYLSQQTEESADKESETQGGEVSDDAETDENDENDDEDEYADTGEVVLIPDPFIEMNKGLYHFNDKLYFWLLKPVARGYGFIIPEELRRAIVNVFYNIRFPVRFINCLLQGKVRKSGAEFGQFFINTTVGFLGLANVAANYPELQPSKEDLGQTFAVWGFDSGAFLMLPFFGPSSLRDGLGRLGDTFLDPIWWAPVDTWTSVAIRAGETVNETSLRIGEYEALKEAAIDPYVMLRNAFVQNRNKVIAE
jgi:phospholipid-binding lipoprotein MlaA